MQKKRQLKEKKERERERKVPSRRHELAPSA